MGQQRVTAQNADEWFMIAGEGDMVLRIRPGMSLGETATGDLTFNPARAQLTLDIADDGSLVLASVADFELESADDTRRARVSLARCNRADIHLAHHVLRVDTDFVDPMRTKGSIVVLTVRPTKKVTEAPVARLRKALAEEHGEPASNVPPLQARPTSQPDAGTTPIPPNGGRRTIVKPLTKRTEVAFDSAHRDGERTSVHRRPILTPGALVGLAVIGLALLYPVLHEVYMPLVADTVRVSPVDPTETPAATSEPSRPAIETVPSVIHLPPQPLRLVDPPTPLVAEPELQAEVRPPPNEQVSDPGSVTAPVTPPPSARSATPTPAEVFSAPEPAAQAERVDSQADAAVLAELEDIGATVRTLTAGMARRRDLLAAGLALTQGRLTDPPEASAYMLYTRVLAQDPDSPEARRGLQSVREGLINRTLAQLAAGQLDQARGSLQAAENVGANPRLIADLHAEIAYRQQQLDARN